MNRYAQLSNNTVQNVIESETDPDGINGEWVLCGNAGPGFTYDGAAFHMPEPVAPARHVTQLAFLSRFTDAEAITLDLASIGATQPAAALRRYQAKVSAAKYIDLDMAETQAGVHALEAMGILAAGRAAEILEAPVQANEAP